MPDHRQAARFCSAGESQEWQAEPDSLDFLSGPDHRQRQQWNRHGGKNWMSALEWMVAIMSTVTIVISVFALGIISGKDQQILRLNDDIARLRREIQRKENP
jgi:hypothetical protein